MFPMSGAQALGQGQCDHIVKNVLDFGKFSSLLPLMWGKIDPWICCPRVPLSKCMA